MDEFNKERGHGDGKFSTRGNYFTTWCDDEAGESETQSRRFEKDGDERGVVTYNPVSKTFTLEEVATKQKFEFDNIDLAAMEIFDLLDD